MAERVAVTSRSYAAAAIILHGWIGYSAEMPLDQRMRDVSGLEVGDGTPHIMKAIIAREAMGREFASYR